MPIAFASLWRPSWIGSWAFWVLTIALLAGFGVGPQDRKPVSTETT